MGFIEFTFHAVDGVPIAGYKSLPEGKPRAVVQIAHGMGEHAGRYEPVADYLVGHGVAVYANDHRGHGKTAPNPEALSHFADEDGMRKVLGDMLSLTGIAKGEQPGVPYFLMGHSMGSLFSRAYTSLHGGELDGLILVGTGGSYDVMARFGRVWGRLMRLLRGGRARAWFMDKLAFMGKLSRIENPRTKSDWLNRDPVEVDKMLADPLCGTIGTVQEFLDLIDLMEFIYDPDSIKYIPQNLSVLFLTGDDDHFGGYGEKVKTIAESYRRVGVSDVSVNLYPGARHELLLETCRDRVYDDLREWLEGRL